MEPGWSKSSKWAKWTKLQTMPLTVSTMLSFFNYSLCVSVFFFVGIIISFHNLSSEFLEGWRIQLFISLLSLIVTRWHHLFRILIWFDIFGSIGELGIKGSGEVHWVNWGLLRHFGIRQVLLPYRATSVSDSLEVRD